MLDLEIRQFRDDLLQQINSATIPLEIKRLVLVELLHAVSEASDNFINGQKQSIVQQLNDPNNVHESPVEETPVE